MKKNILVIGIVSIFLLSSFAVFPGVGMETAETEKSLDGSITLDPAEPTGRFWWYVTSVKVIFHAHDPPHDSSGLYCIKYRVITGGGDVNPEWETHYIDEYCTDYDFDDVILSEDGIHIVEFQAADGFLKGKPINWGDVHSSPKVRIDMTPPTVTVTKEKINIFKYIFSASVDDATSGDFGVVEFFLDGELQTADSQLPYEWIWSGFGKHSVEVKAYDVAGNSASGSNSTIYSRFSQHFTKSFFRHFPLLEWLLYLSFFPF